MSAKKTAERWMRTMGAGAVAAALAASPASATVAKNVILMISDGQGFNTIQATDYYTGTTGVYESFDVKFAMQTSSANNPAGYNAASMATSFTYAKSGATDSASAATAMYTGVKNYDGQVNWSTSGQPLTTYFENAAQAGRSIGAVTSVEFSHATPAAVYGHNSSRNNYSAIANEGIYGDYNGNLKVLMGAGNGDYNDSNSYQTSVSDQYVGGTTTWNDIKDTNGANGFALVDSKAEFEALTTGATPEKVIGVAQVATTLQQARSNPAGNFDTKNSNVPTLETMTKGALNVLDNDSDGFAVMIEGGAIDWANHANQLDRMIEEQIDFNNAVQAVVDWVNANSSWDETLLIVTADHECGYLWGSGTGSFVDVNGNGVFDNGVDYGHVVNNGVGVLPGAKFYSGDHSNSLVPVFAKGAGSELLASYVIGTDSNLASRYNLDGSWTGQYIDNTSLYHVMEATLVPEPATMALLMLGGAAMLRRRTA